MLPLPIVNDVELQNQIAAARAYEELHVPALFEQWPVPVMEAARIESGQRVLDVACGTGVLARQLSARVGSGGFVAGVDPGPGMLAVAAEISPELEWQLATAESLPYPDDSFDRVVSQFGLMFFSDRRQALREMVRVLLPGGRLTLVVWDALERSPAYREEVDLLDRLAGREAADVLRAPFVLGDRERLAEHLDSAGVTSIKVTTHVGTARFPSVRVMVEADLRGWLPVMGVTLDEALIERILGEAETILEPYVTEEGEVVFDAPAHIVSGVKPPKRPATR